MRLKFTQDAGCRQRFRRDRRRQPGHQDNAAARETPRGPAFRRRLRSGAAHGKASTQRRRFPLSHLECRRGEVEQCGNGARCFVRFVHDKGLTKKNEIRVETLSGVIVPRPGGGRAGERRYGRADIRARTRALRQRAACGLCLEAGAGPLDLAGSEAVVAVLSMGNPHAVQTVAEVDSAPVTTEGPSIERHPRFSATRERGVCADCHAHPHPPSRNGARCRRDARLRHGRLRCGRRGHPRGTARRFGAGRHARRPIDDTLGGRENDPTSTVWMTGPGRIRVRREIEIES